MEYCPFSARLMAGASVKLRCGVAVGVGSSGVAVLPAAGVLSAAGVGVAVLSEVAANNGKPALRQELALQKDKAPAVRKERHRATKPAWLRATAASC